VEVWTLAKALVIFMKRPLLMVALVCGAGIVLADSMPERFPVGPSLAVSFALAVAAMSWSRARPVLVWLLVFAVGATILTLQKSVLSPHDLRRVLGSEPVIVTLRGVLPETPWQRTYERDDKESWRTVAYLDATGLRTKGNGWQPATGRVAVSTPGQLAPVFFGGRAVELEGVLLEPRGPVAEGVFDYPKFLRRQGVYYQLQVSTTNDWRLATGADPKAPWPLTDRFSAWGKAALARGLPVEDEPLRLLWAMTLGWKTALNGEVSEPFMRSGTMHIFAISGLHVALIAGLLVLLLRVFRVPRGVCGWVVVPLIWFYAGATGWQASAIRSTIMMSVIIVGWALRRPSDLINSLAAAAFIILLWDPQQLFQAGFQLSFLVVFSLALFVPVFDALRAPWTEPDPAQPETLPQIMVRKVPLLGFLFPDPFQPAELRSRWQRWLGIPARHVWSAAITSLAAWVGSIPLIAYYFHLMTPVGLLANLVIVPLSSVALACNLASLAISAFVPLAAELFNNAAWFFMVLMVRLSEWAAHAPGGCWNVAGPSLAGFTLYYTLLVSVMAGWVIRPKRRVWMASILVLLTALYLIEWRRDRANASMTILPLNGGEAVYFKPARSSYRALIDCGNESTAEFVLKPFLRAQGVNRLDSLVLTHGDIHNVGGARLVQERFPPRQVLFSHVSFRSGAYRDMVRRFSETPGLTQTLRRGDQFGQWTVLHPDETDRFTQADDNAIVLLGVIDGVRVLLLSDLGKPGQNALMGRYPDLRADVVVSGLPGGTEPLADAFLDAVKPHLIIITDSEYPAAQRASRVLRERLAARPVPVVYTRETGAVTLRIRDGHWSARGMNEWSVSDRTLHGP
jgi:ComEC/Rec2-related protein